jgi:hypothetical protein
MIAAMARDIRCYELHDYQFVDLHPISPSYVANLVCV